MNPPSRDASSPPPADRRQASPPDEPLDRAADTRPLPEPELTHFGAGPAWSQLYHSRKEMAAQLGKDVFRLPLRRRVREVLLDHLTDGQRVLEVGAGERKMGGELRARLPHLRYESMDVDRRLPHDYYSLHDAEGPFDAIFALEVIEHLPLSAIATWLIELRDRLRPGGTLVLSTPNTFYPPAYLRDATHCTPLCYDELAGLATASGLRVKNVFRIYHDPVHRRLLRRYLLGWLFRAIGIDFARQIVLVARR